MVDYSLGRWMRDKSICQPLEKVDVCMQLCNGLSFLHEQVTLCPFRAILAIILLIHIQQIKYIYITVHSGHGKKVALFQ